MKKTLLGIALMILMFTSYTASANVAYDNLLIDEKSKITIDGKYDDWENVEGLNLTLKPAEDENKDVGNFKAQFRSVRDTELIYFLVIIQDKYNFFNPDTGVAHHAAPAFAMSFPIDEGAKNQFMGGNDRTSDEELNTTTGLIDIIHWEMGDVLGTTAGGSKSGADAKGKGVNDLDDEYATGPWDRHDDNDATSENSLTGVVTFTADQTNGTVGSYVFEFSRKLTTGDKYDHQFKEGETVPVAIAYWTPYSNPEGEWGDDQHVVNYDSVIDMTLSTDTVKTPGFLISLSLITFLAMIPIYRRRK